MEERRIKFIKPARRHRIGRARALAAMESAGEPEVIPADEDFDAERLLWIGTDNRGVELEVIGVVREDGTLVIIHAMPTHYRRKRGP